MSGMQTCLKLQSGIWSIANKNNKNGNADRRMIPLKGMTLSRVEVPRVICNTVCIDLFQIIDFFQITLIGKQFRGGRAAHKHVWNYNTIIGRILSGIIITGRRMIPPRDITMSMFRMSEVPSVGARALPEEGANQRLLVVLGEVGVVMIRHPRIARSGGGEYQGATRWWERWRFWNGFIQHCLSITKSWTWGLRLWIWKNKRTYMKILII